MGGCFLFGDFLIVGFVDCGFDCGWIGFFCGVCFWVGCCDGVVDVFCFCCFCCFFGCVYFSVCVRNGGYFGVFVVSIYRGFWVF